MAFSGGVFSRLYNWATEQASAPIEIAKLDAQEEDIATALSNCILRDGTGIPTAATPWNSQRLTTLGAATARTDAIRASQVQDNSINVLSSVAGTNTITASLTPAITAHSAGMMVVLTPANTNTGAVTLNVNSVGALDILDASGSALVGGELLVGVPVLLILDAGADDWIIASHRVTRGTFTVTLTGMTSSTTGTITYTISDGWVRMWATANILGTSNSTAMEFQGIPAAARPTGNRYPMCSMNDEGQDMPCLVVLSSGGANGIVTGAIQNGTADGDKVTYSNNGFTNSGQKGIPAGWSMSYPL